MHRKWNKLLVNFHVESAFNTFFTKCQKHELCINGIAGDFFKCIHSKTSQASKTLKNQARQGKEAEKAFT